jgi:GAF domain-containing protein
VKRRSGIVGKPVKKRRRKATTPKRGNTPKAARRRGSPPAGRETPVARLTRELRESLQQQTATANVLEVISRSTFDLQTVLDTLAESAARLCAADKGVILQQDGDVHLVLANYGFSPEMAQYAKEHPLPGNRASAVGRAALEGRVIHIPDVLTDPEYRAAEMQQAVGYRTALAVPLVREGTTIGVFALLRDEANPFADKQIELVQNFADQAVIAIENTRLFNEVQAKTRDLSEALIYQTGSANILRVIASSPTDVGPVLKAIIDSACELCEANDAAVLLRDGDDLRFSAHQGPIPIGLEKWPINRNWAGGRAFVDREPVHVHDLLAEGAEFPDGREFARRMGHRSILSVPLLREGESVGVIVLRRTEVHPFGDKQIALLQTFADQAVIAIENVRLFDDVQKRTAELTEALEQQTATSDILRAIAAAPGDADGTLRKIAETTARLFGAVGVAFRIAEGDEFKLSVGVGQGAEQIGTSIFDDPTKRPKVHGRNLPGSVVRENRQINIPDLDKLDHEQAQWPGLAVARSAGIRTMAGTPLRTEGRAIGALTVYRNVLQPFEPAELQLQQSFADQAVIAIENARLLNETKEALEQQTATAEVLQVISRSPGDLQPVFDALLANAVRVCGARFGNMSLVDGNGLRIVAMHNAPPQFEELRRRDPVIPLDRSPLGRLFRTKEVQNIGDLGADEVSANSVLVKVAGARAALCVPMLKEDNLVGALVLYRMEPSPFTDKQIELLTNFAAQAVIAIENTRLLTELRQRTADLTKSLEDLHTTQDRLVQTEKLASLGQLTAGIAHEIKNPLNFVNNFSSVSVELVDELQQALGGAQLDGKLRAEIDEIADMLRGNLDKVVQHGKRADSIVKNMLLHSRQGSGEHRPVDINAVVEESLNLAYHGARAEKQGFNITLERSFDPAAGEVDLFPQEITRVLLNLISNGFYAATKRKAEANGGDYEPTLAATTKNLGDSVEIKIRDNGTGIPPEVKEKMFNPFFTTKPAGEGTGLGLSLSHDIIVKQHAGSIEVDTRPGEFTEFRIVLPRGAATIVKTGEKT